MSDFPKEEAPPLPRHGDDHQADFSRGKRQLMNCDLGILRAKERADVPLIRHHNHYVSHPKAAAAFYDGR
jgi:hypothetical protein